jgi:protocatechuate 3,4-dioxygenase beta subunit
VLDLSLEIPFTQATGADGSFDLEAAPFVQGAQLTAHLAGYSSWSAEVPSYPNSELTIVLTRPHATAGMLTGLVVDPRGAPVPEADVSFGLDATRTGADGTFAIDLAAEDSTNAKVSSRFGLAAPNRLLAFKSGFLPAAMELARDAEGELSIGAPIVLALGGAPLSIAGRVVDAAGAPLEGLEVWIADTTLFSMGREGAVVLENELVEGRGEDRWHRETTDAQGRFEIDGLMDREYTLEAMDPATLLRARPVKAAAGARDVELVLSKEALFERVAGRVVTRSGAPVADVVVFPMCDGFRLSYQEQVVSTSHSSVDGVRTGADGRFELKDVPRDLVYLRVNGEDTLPVEYGRHVEGGLAALGGARAGEGRLEDLEIVVPLRVRLRVELSNPAEADAVAVLDEAGEPIVINVIAANGRREDERMPIVAGRTEVLTVTDSAATLVLLAGNSEVRRVPLALRRGDVNVVVP